MIQAEVALERLLPIDAEVLWQGVQGYVTARDNILPPLKNIVTLPYPEDVSENHIILDGHHTAKAARIRGLVAVRASVITEDAELAEFISRERNWYPWQALGSKGLLRLHYRTDWAVRMEARGVQTIDDVPEVIHEPRSYRRPHDLMSIPVDRNGRPLKTT